MEILKNIKVQLPIAIVMLTVSIFMAISYHQLVWTDQADNLSVVAYYVWLVSIPVWVGKTIHDVSVLRKGKVEK